jgi:hypothetical protein
MAKLAVTVRASVIKTTHSLVPPRQAPVQPLKTLFAFGVALSLIVVSALKVFVQIVPQLIPVGLEEIKPVAVPVVLVVRR